MGPRRLAGALRSVSHQGTYIGALNQIAAAAGGYVQPHASTQTIKVLPRYPSVPWEWDSVVPDFELPVDVTSRESIKWLEKPAYNRVFVSGQEVGVLAQVTRAGTAGDVLAPLAVDALITHAAAARHPSPPTLRARTRSGPWSRRRG